VTRKRQQQRTDLAAVRRATKALHVALQAAADARRRLALATRPGAPPFVVGPALRWAYQMLEARSGSLLQIEGVVGYGLGKAIRDGVTTDEPAITIFVRRKLSSAQLKKLKQKSLPRTMSSKNKRIRVDVIEVGDIEQLAFAGESTGPNNDPHEPEGTIGAFATDFDDGNTVAITAMHVSRLQDFPIGNLPAPEFVVPSVKVQSPETQRLGVLAFGTTRGVDAAKITLDDPADASNTIPTIGELQGWRSVASPADDGITVFMFGARSKRCEGRIVQALAHMPNIGLGAVVIVDIPAVPGDSGAALVDEQRHALGFLVGKFNKGPFAGKAVFSSAAAVVDALNCDF